MTENDAPNSSSVLTAAGKAALDAEVERYRADLLRRAASLGGRYEGGIEITAADIRNAAAGLSKERPRARFNLQRVLLAYAFAGVAVALIGGGGFLVRIAVQASDPLQQLSLFLAIAGALTAAIAGFGLAFLRTGWTKAERARDQNDDDARAQFLDLWLQLESRLRSMAGSSLAGRAREVPFSLLLRTLATEKALTPTEEVTIRELVGVRNNLVHPELTSTAADYDQESRRLRSLLADLAHDSPKGDSGSSGR